MKIKHVLMTLALAAATLTAAGQTVTPDGGTPIEAIYLTTGELQNAKTLNISGTWTTGHVTKLRKAITGNELETSGSNAVLQTVTFSSTAVMGSMKYLFADCTALKSVTMPTETNSKAVSFEYAFSGCTALAGSINLSGFTNITDMYKAFYNCAALQGVTMPTAPNATAVSFKSAFRGCTALAGTVNLSGFTKISDMQSAFYGCAALQGVTMPTGTNTAAVSFSGAFNGCAALAGTVDLSGFTKISTMQNAFFSCAVLGSVTMPTETNTAAVSFSGAFAGCKALESIDLRAFTAISSMASAFSGCTRLTLDGLQLPATNTPPAAGVSFLSAFEGCTALAGSIDLSVFTNIKSMESAFNGCTGITGVTLPAVENATAVTFLNAFKGCTALKSVDLSKFTAISNMWSAFEGCTALTSVKLGGALPATTTSAFSNVNYNCLVYVPAGWTKPASGWSNIIYISGGTAEEYVILTDNVPFHCPEPFALGTDYRMRYYRDLTQNQWATVCLPFAAPVPADCIAKELSSSTGETVTFAEVQTMQANKPYIVAYTGGSAIRGITFTSEAAATIPATPEAMETEPANASYKMAGTYEDITERSMYLLGVNSFLLYNQGNLHPFRAYITATGGAPNQAPSLAIGNEGDATGIGCIESPEAEAIPAISHVYTLDGRLVKTVPAEEYSTLKQGLERGVYIVNGKKVTVTE